MALQLPGETLVKAIVGLVLGLLFAWAIHTIYSDFKRGNEAQVELKHSQGRVAGEQAARAEEQASTSTSEAIADDTRSSATAETKAATADTANQVKIIERIYVDNPDLAKPCRDDGGPAPMPAGVLEQLDKARAAVIEAAPPAG